MSSPDGFHYIDHLAPGRAARNPPPERLLDKFTSAFSGAKSVFQKQLETCLTSAQSGLRIRHAAQDEARDGDRLSVHGQFDAIGGRIR